MPNACLSHSLPCPSHLIYIRRVPFLRSANARKRYSTPSISLTLFFQLALGSWIVVHLVITLIYAGHSRIQEIDHPLLGQTFHNLCSHRLRTVDPSNNDDTNDIKLQLQLEPHPPPSRPHSLPARASNSATCYVQVQANANKKTVLQSIISAHLLPSLCSAHNRPDRLLPSSRLSSTSA